MKKVVILSAILGIILLIIAVVYFITPANSLPGFFPGFDPTSSKAHFKHGVGSLLLALAIFAYGWFQSGKKSSQKIDTNNPTSN